MLTRFSFIPCKTRSVKPILRRSALGAALVLLILPGWLAPAWESADAATKTAKQCQSRYGGCFEKCMSGAKTGHGTGYNPTKLENCLDRTCFPQLQNCLKEAKGASSTTKLTASPGSPTTPPKKGGRFTPGLLEQGQGLSTQGPAATGAPVGGASSGGSAAPAGRLY